VAFACLYVNFAARGTRNYNLSIEVLNSEAAIDVVMLYSAEYLKQGGKMQKEVPSPRVELGTNRLTEYYSRV